MLGVGQSGSLELESSNQGGTSEPPVRNTISNSFRATDPFLVEKAYEELRGALDSPRELANLAE